ncbi:hypothetical protein [Yoonia vestfoldensis]|jgi:hypothetical protein|uniref:2'-deoxycytidine 5'-triphosphate deaminase n=1 Tax=Yoonia vestfoldensis SKA53 TaxID=314232 RepID=A3V6G9_9RHOB|nr:hypothetical protein [Yoonia vestfoldensis]EAQ06493.1 2'-deoxycytidine 5'-triphosphate deaminase [Yoonia vestfoldensis SKA53]
MKIIPLALADTKTPAARKRKRAMISVWEKLLPYRGLSHRAKAKGVVSGLS